MIVFSSIVVIGYFMFWGYTYLLVTKVQKALYDNFPKEADQYLGPKQSRGISKKAGILFLWETNVKELAKKDKNIERLRKRASTCIILLLPSIFLMLGLIALGGWLIGH
jgi:hypothetical protein